MTDVTRTETPAAAPAVAPRRTSGRSILAALFWLLSCLAILAGGVTLWAHQTVLTANGWGSIVTAVAADEATAKILRQTEIKALRLNYEIDAVHKVAQSVDLALVASGSATLQVAAAACPMAIMYQSNKYLWKLIGRRIVTTKYLSLVNILAQDELVPEFMPEVPIDPIDAQPMRYTRLPRGYRIYSLGQNSRDDNGTEMKSQWMLAPGTDYDVTFSVER
jgi:hypothetical protein